jgi:hypothetical protein
MMRSSYTFDTKNSCLSVLKQVCVLNATETSRMQQQEAQSITTAQWIANAIADASVTGIVYGTYDILLSVLRQDKAC